MKVGRFNLGNLSKYRTELMGLSALLILFCHSIAYIELPRNIHYMISFGNIGVDLFLFLSGMGMWYSLTKLKKGMLFWYTDRYKKLFVPYLLVLLSIEAVKFALGKQVEHGIWNYLLGISSLRFYVSHDAAWFIAALIPLYLLAPFFFFLIKKFTWKATILLIVLLYIILFIPPCFTSELVNNIMGNIQFVAVRATCFVLGMSLGQFIKKNSTISMGWLIGMTLVGFLAIVVTSHLVYGYFFFTLPLLSVFCCMIDRCSKWLINFFYFMGGISLESYILNGSLPKLLILTFITLDIPTINNLFPYAVACILGTFLAYIFHRISDRIIYKGQLKYS